jgi:uroporphyrinogen-III decarboxylase
VGERGITLYGLYHTMYAVHGLIGSENFAYWSIDHRDLILEALTICSRRITDEVNRLFDAGLKPMFGWVGPELCIPPLASPRDFDEFVYRFDKPLVDLIHERGGSVWVHCHGDMNPMLERFVEMGVDVLNPIEPPPIGSLTLAEAFDRVGDRMALEGNIETHDLITAGKERIVELVREAIDAAGGHRLILCPCSGFMEWPEPPGNLAENLLTFLEEGVRYAKVHSYA